MSAEPSELRSVAWVEVFPFLRLFRTFQCALAWKMVLALGCIIVIYLFGRILDGAWLKSGHGVEAISGIHQASEIAAYAANDPLTWQAWLKQREAQTLEQRGPFIALLDYEMACFAAAIESVFACRWGFSDPMSDGARPGMLSSVASAARGGLWLVLSRPWYAALFGLLALVVLALGGGAICRIAAVQSCRDENMGVGEALRFSRRQWGNLLAGPLLVFGILVGLSLVLALGGVIGAIPYLGEIFTGITFGLALLIGIGLALALVALVLGIHLMTPAIAVENSDGFDAVSRGAGFIFQRPLAAGFYWFVLLVFGAFCFVLVRGVAMLVLKLSHTMVGIGMSLFGAVHGGTEKSLPKLEALWHMPAWRELRLIPTASGPNFWGDFGHVALGGTESAAAFLIAAWVFLVVALVGAFVLTYYFCGCTEMYLLLRKQIDGVDHDEIFYEGPLDEGAEQESAVEVDPANVSLPVMERPPTVP